MCNPLNFYNILMQRGAYMKFYNCRNKNGFDIDGSMDQFERKFDQGFCNWEMVSGKSGTYLRTIDLRHDLEKWFGPESFMRSYDLKFLHLKGLY